MKIQLFPIEELKAYENNPRRISADAIKAVSNSIREFGFKVPVIIDKEKVIVAGHARVLASKELGLKEIPCIVADDLTPEQIKAFRLADNKTSELTCWDFERLDIELEELAELEFDMFQFGFENESFETDFRKSARETPNALALG
jgi:site-specific DNA-methyltransferase (adenine-specific)